MPTVTVEVKFSYSKEEEARIIDAVHTAMMFSLKTPEWDKIIRLVVHEPHRFTSPPNMGEKFTLISLDMFSGRSIEAKRSFYRALVENLVALDIPRNEILIVLREQPTESWGIQGGTAACDISIPWLQN